MGKMQDRVFLGIISGLGGAVAKNLLSELLIRSGFAEYGGPERAAGMLVPAHKIATTRGKLVGWIADTTISGFLGIATVYALSVTGKEKAPLKGALIGGMAAWTAFYGALGTMGVTQVQNAAPRTVLSEFLVHSLYGATTATIATRLGDEGLFNGQIPWSPVGLRKQREIVTADFRPRIGDYQIQRRYMTN